MVPGSLFEFTSRYVPDTRQQQLVALYALTQSLGAIPITPGDESIKWAKLKWWSEELLAEPSSPSRHPVLRMMWQSGARQNLDNGLLLRLVSDAISQIDIVPDAHENAMFERLAAKGETEILLELALDRTEIGTGELNNLAAASGVFALISGASVGCTPGKLHLPLDLLAKYQLTTTLLEQDPPGPEMLTAMSQLAESGQQWFTKGLSGISVSNSMHLRLRWVMEARLLARFSKNAGKRIRSGNLIGPTDAWFAWRYCRKPATANKESRVNANVSG